MTVQIASVIITGHSLVAAEFYSFIYNYWVIMGFDIFLALFWLITFSITAANEVNSSGWMGTISEMGIMAQRLIVMC